MRQPSSGFTFQKYKKRNPYAAAIHTTVKITAEISPLNKIFVDVTFGKHFYDM
jgi:hypothetical protein